MKKYSVIFLFLICNINLWAQSEFPLVQNFFPQTYKANSKNWDMVQDSAGLIYFANNDGVLIYNGGTWQTIKTLNPVRSLCLAPNNQVLVGCKEDFGVIKPNDNGILSFFSYRSLLGNASLSFNEIISIYIKGNLANFISDKVVFQTDINAKSLQKPLMTNLEDEISGTAFVNEEIVVYAVNQGLKTYQNSKLINHPAATAFEALGIFKCVNVSKSKILCASLNESLFWFENGTVTPLKSSIDDDLKKMRISDIAVSKSGTIAIGTFSSGVFILNSNGELLYKLNELKGLPENDIYSVHFDNQENLWVGHGKGISHFKLKLGVTMLKMDSTPNGKIAAAQYFEGKIYLGTTNGLYMLDAGKLSKFADAILSTDEIWALQEFNGSLLVGCNSGLYAIKGAKSTPLIVEKGVFKLTKEQGAQTTWFAGENCAGKVSIDGDKFQVQNFLKNVSIVANSIFQGKDGTVWVGTEFRGLIKIANETQATFFGKSQGLSDGKVFVSQINGEPVFQTNEGFYQAKDKTFVPVNSINKFQFTKSAFIKFNEKFHFLNSNGISTLNISSFDQAVLDSNSVLQYFNQIPSAIFQNDNSYFLAFGNEIYRINKQQNSNNYTPTITINFIEANDSILFNGVFKSGESFNTYQNSNEELVISAENNSFVIHVGLSDYLTNSSNTYQYIIDGADNRWSNWSNNPEIHITNATEGLYIVKVRVKNSFGKIYEKQILRYRVLPPWYRSVWAYLSYVIISILVIWLLIKLNTRRLEAKNIELENIVAERTKEVVEQKNIIEEKNKDITDSIRYASRIQKAILPNQDILKENFNHFIFFKPRDIVSGDFYWFNLIGDNLFIAAVDCTGHGVPGALMSVIGNNAINSVTHEVIRLDTVTLVEKLDQKVMTYLNQSDSDSQSKDGMDIALVKLNLRTGDFEFTGCNRPLILVRNGEIEEIKGDKFPIGGGQYDGKQYSKFTTTLLPKDRFYIFSDGYPDQFGGPDGRKLTSKRLRDTITEMQSVSMDEQHNKIAKLFNDWKGNLEQTDDVLFMGLEYKKPVF